MEKLKIRSFGSKFDGLLVRTMDSETKALLKKMLHEYERSKHERPAYLRRYQENLYIAFFYERFGRLRHHAKST